MHDQRLSDMHDQALYHGYVAMDPTLRAQEAGKLQHGLNEDWKSALLRYPDVLDHFYGQVRLDLPDDDDEELGGGPLVGEIQGLKGRLAQIRLGLGAGPGMGPGMGSGMGSGMGGPMLYREMDPGQQQQQQQQQLQQYPHPHPGHHHPPLPKGYLRTRPGPVYPPSMPPAPSSGPMPGAFPSNTIPPPAPQAPGWMPYPGY